MLANNLVEEYADTVPKLEDCEQFNINKNKTTNKLNLDKFNKEFDSCRN